jgi:predicted transposase YdaD
MFGIRLEETRVYQEAKEEGREEGREEERQRLQSLVLRQLARCFGKIPKKVKSRMDELSLDEWERLGDAFFDFESIADLDIWLDKNA